MSSEQNFIKISAGSVSLRFVHVPLTFIAHGLTNVFAQKNNKTLGETLVHRRYEALSGAVMQQYPSALGKPLGDFLADLKQGGDDLYRRFLNPHGDKTYCHFRMADGPEKRQKGLYAYTAEDEIVYIGRSYDPFGKRVDQGYGKIHPKNCYIDGQSTNCHLNSLIESQPNGVRFFVCVLNDDSEIETLERILIRERKPSWNVALTR